MGWRCGKRGRETSACPESQITRPRRHFIHQDPEDKSKTSIVPRIKILWIKGGWECVLIGKPMLGERIFFSPPGYMCVYAQFRFPSRLIKRGFFIPPIARSHRFRLVPSAILIGRLRPDVFNARDRRGK